jgi:hypothetical protein
LREFVERGKLPREALGAGAVRAADVGQVDAQIMYRSYSLRQLPSGCQAFWQPI